MIAEKEKKSSSYKEGKLDALSDEKIAKMKKFAKEYINKYVFSSNLVVINLSNCEPSPHRILHKLEKSGKRRIPPSTPSTTLATTSTTMTTPDPYGNASANGVNIAIDDMAIDGPMDMDTKSESDDERAENPFSNGIDNNDEDPPYQPRRSLLGEPMSPDPMDLFRQPEVSNFTSDPRLRISSLSGPDKMALFDATDIWRDSS